MDYLIIVLWVYRKLTGRETLRRMNDETIYSHEDTLRMLDALFRDEGAWWDGFYADKEKGIPFFRDCPDENLVESFSEGALICCGHWNSSNCILYNGML